MCSGVRFDKLAFLLEILISIQSQSMNFDFTLFYTPFNSFNSLFFAVIVTALAQNISVLDVIAGVHMNYMNMSFFFGRFPKFSGIASSIN